MIRELRDSATFSNQVGPAATFVKNASEAEIYAIDVSFAALADKAERECLDELPMTFSLKGEVVDRLRAAAAKTILDSPEFRRLLANVGARVITGPPSPP